MGSGSVSFRCRPIKLSFDPPDSARVAIPRSALTIMAAALAIGGGLLGELRIDPVAREALDPPDRDEIALERIGVVPVGFIVEEVQGFVATTSRYVAIVCRRVALVADFVSTICEVIAVLCVTVALRRCVIDSDAVQLQ